MKPHENLDPLVIGGTSYHSRLLIGTGKYRDFAETKAAVDASGAAIVTVAIRRTNIGSYQGHGTLISAGTFTDGTLTGITLMRYGSNGR